MTLSRHILSETDIDGGDTPAFSGHASTYHADDTEPSPVTRTAQEECRSRRKMFCRMSVTVNQTCIEIIL
jgi:hypothetical protein